MGAHDAGHGPAEDSYVGNSLSYGATASQDIVYYPNGQPSADLQSFMVPDKVTGYDGTQTTVNYRTRTWSRMLTWNSQLVEAPTSCSWTLASGLGSIDFAARPDAARTLLSCSGLTVTRGLRIDGIDAIKIADANAGTLWINATTYLPIESVTTSQTRLGLPLLLGSGADGTPTGQTVLYGYLTPTATNLAYLSAPHPRGFTGTTSRASGFPTGKYLTPWTPPAGVIPPFGLQPVAADDSLTAADAAKDILWVRMTTEAIPASDTVIDSQFNYRTASRDLTYYPDGKPWDDDNTYVRPDADGKSTSVHTIVLYNNQTVSVSTTSGAITSGSPLGGCATTDGCGSPPGPQAACATAQTTGLANIDYQATPDAARALLSCKGQVVTRGLTLDGVDAIKIAGRDSETLWINAATYLPIEIVVTYSRGDMPPAGYNNTKSPEQIYQYTWLAPTPANLAYLGIPTPAGFKLDPPA